MPDPTSATDQVAEPTTSAPPTLTRAGLVSALADAVLAVNGVAGLEPTISTAGPRFLIDRKPTDGIRILLRAGTAEVDANIAVTGSCRARTVARDVHTALADLLDTSGYPSHSITVSVLRITAAENRGMPEPDQGRGSPDAQHDLD